MYDYVCCLNEDGAYLDVSCAVLVYEIWPHTKCTTPSTHSHSIRPLLKFG
jgi:hypothetical protein